MLRTSVQHTDQAPATHSPLELPRKWLTTAEVAWLFGLKPESLVAAHCRNGNWNGIRPVKMPNRRLMWPSDDVQKILAR